MLIFIKQVCERVSPVFTCEVAWLFILKHKPNDHGQARNQRRLE